MSEQTAADAGERTGNYDTVEDFNRECPIGTPVLAFPGSRDGRALYTKTRSSAWMIGPEPVVMVEGYAGGIALTHIEVVPPTQPPAAPETDVRLTEAERRAFWQAMCEWNDVDDGFGRDKPSNAILYAAVECIVAERVRVVEGERDAARAELRAESRRADKAVERAHHYEGQFRVREQEPDHRRRAESAEAAHEAEKTAHAETERLRALWFGENSQAQASLANEKAAHEALRKGIEALAEGDLWEHADTLRALLAGGAR